LGLSSLRFQLIENACEGGNLPFIEIELMSQKAERPADAEAAATAITAFIAFFSRLAFPSSTFRPATRPTAVTATTCESALSAPPGHECWMHDHSPYSRGLFAPRRGLLAWATCLTLCIHLSADAALVKQGG